jgi:steroid 5-alpha reductase family enzyme
VPAGLWKYARYPNYLGEMTIWWGIWIACLPAMSGAYYVSIVSPLFVMALLLFSPSAIPTSEKQAQQRWGSEAAYHEYRRSTNLLLPLPLPK